MLENLQPLHIFLFHHDISKVGYLAMNQFQYSVLHCYTQQAVSRINFEEEAFWSLFRFAEFNQTKPNRFE